MQNRGAGVSPAVGRASCPRAGAGRSRDRGRDARTTRRSMNVQMLARLLWWCVILYVVVLVALLGIMRQPALFGQVMSRVPKPLLTVIPLKQLWMLARAGNLKVGDVAPDFSLPTVDRKARVRLSSFRGNKPVVLVFGSYT